MGYQCAHDAVVEEKVFVASCCKFYVASYELLAASHELLVIFSNLKSCFMKNFKELKIWNKGFDIAVKTFKLVNTFPKEEKFGVCSQMTKSAVSISSNIAEGSSRTSQRDYLRFIEISLGSTFELETQLLIAQAVGFGTNQLRDEILRDINEEEKMLISFMNKLKA
jgi:four helix bundle protein